MHARTIIATIGTIATGVAVVGLQQRPALAGDAPEPASPEYVAQRIQEIERELTSIKRDRSPSWLTESHEDELLALVREIETDAANRTSLLTNNGNAGYDRGFKIQSENGDFTLVLDAFSQFQALWNIRDMSDGDDSTFGFQNHRTRVIAKGRAYGDELRYHIAGDFRDQNGGHFMLTDAYLRAKLGNGASVWWGQMKAPFSREQATPSRYLMTVERSYVNEVMGVGERTQGVMFKMRPSERLRFAVMVSDGADVRVDGENSGRSNTPWDGDGNEFAFTGRGEWLWPGVGGTQEEADLWRSMLDSLPRTQDGTIVLAGAGAHWQRDEYGTGAFEDEYVLWTADITAKLSGFSILGAVNGLHASSNAPGSMDRDQIGFVFQGAFVIAEDQADVFARYEHIDFDGAVPAGYDDSVSLITAGFNYYLNGHASKLTTDVVFGLDPIPAAAGNLGILRDAANQDGQVVVRSQFQFAFK